MSLDPYQTLGISPNATLQEARTAWLQRVRVLHPDRFDPVKQKNEMEYATRMLQDVNAAWDTIRTGGDFASNQGAARSPSPEQRDDPPPMPEQEAKPAPFSGLAITSFVLILLSLRFPGIFLLFFIVAIIFAHIAKSSIRKHGYRGRWMATSSLWVGYLGLIGIIALMTLLSWDDSSRRKKAFAVDQSSHPSAPGLQGNPSGQSDGSASAPGSPATLAETKQQIELLNNELAELDKEQKHDVGLSETNLDTKLADAKSEVAAIQSKIAEQTKALADLKQKCDPLEKEMDSLNGAREAIDNRYDKDLQNHEESLSNLLQARKDMLQYAAKLINDSIVSQNLSVDFVPDTGLYAQEKHFMGSPPLIVPSTDKSKQGFNTASSPQSGTGDYDNIFNNMSMTVAMDSNPAVGTIIANKAGQLSVVMSVQYYPSYNPKYPYNAYCMVFCRFPSQLNDLKVRQDFVSLYENHIKNRETADSVQKGIASTTEQKGLALRNWDYVNGGRLKELRDNVSDMAVQISKIETELKSDNSVLNEQLNFLNAPRAEQLSQIHSQISSKFDERRRLVKEKLAQLE